jgi:hypothetical protein
LDAFRPEVDVTETVYYRVGSAVEEIQSVEQVVEDKLIKTVVERWQPVPYNSQQKIGEITQGKK